SRATAGMAGRIVKRPTKIVAAANSTATKTANTRCQRDMKNPRVTILGPADPGRHSARPIKGGPKVHAARDDVGAPVAVQVAASDGDQVRRRRVDGTQLKILPSVVFQPDGAGKAAV